MSISLFQKVQIVKNSSISEFACWADAFANFVDFRFCRIEGFHVFRPQTEMKLFRTPSTYLKLKHCVKSEKRNPNTKLSVKFKNEM